VNSFAFTDREIESNHPKHKPNLFTKEFIPASRKDNDPIRRAANEVFDKHVASGHLVRELDFVPTPLKDRKPGWYKKHGDKFVTYYYGAEEWLFGGGPIVKQDEFYNLSELEYEYFATHSVFTWYDWARGSNIAKEAELFEQRLEHSYPGNWESPFNE